jgi:hypothetical protein
MCTELILAIIYISILILINFLLFTFLKTYQQKILYLLKLRIILNSFNKNDLQIVLLFDKYFKKDLTKLKSEKFDINLNNLQNIVNYNDIVSLGTFSKFLNRYDNKKMNSRSFFYNLLENQYLPK